MSSGRIDSLAFIGSSGAAKAIMNQHPSAHTLHKVLGLGAKNSGVALPSADIDKVVDEVVAGALTFNGQRCTALKTSSFIQVSLRGLSRSSPRR
jgi:glyceraldehyde-3-phosphate dehydrogenase (NADP+)